jgi:glycosyltransferase involved in cell wall biosynthesis
MILDHSFPPDLRVENEARTLIKEGFEVAILAIGDDERPALDNLDGLTIYRYRLSNNVRNKLRGLSGSLPLIEWVYGRKIRGIYSEWPFDALHAHDLYLFGTCLRVGRALNVKVVGDMHENWVHALSEYRWSTHYPGKLFINLTRWDQLETAWSKDVDRLVVVIDEMKHRMVSKSVEPDHIVIVPNTISRGQFDNMLQNGRSSEKGHPADSKAAVGTGEKSSGNDSGLKLIYTGGMDLHRGLSSLLDAMPEILKAIPDAELTMVGDGSVRADLEKRAASLGIADIVHFEGWQPQELIPGYIQRADIGLIPHLKSVHTDNTIPHKLFHYMYLGLPVVASDCNPLKRIIEAERAGRVYASGDPGGLAQAVISLAADSDKRSEMGNNGMNAVKERYNWEHTASGLIELYEDLLG